MKKSTKCLFTAAAAAMAGIYTYNKFVETTSTKNNLLSEEQGLFYEWIQGNIFYTKKGSGTPILLLHDINSSSSSEEWLKISKRLAKDHTVYSLDLIGCGRSDKPPIQYTNYLYVQLISSFVKDVIQERTSVVAVNLTASAVLFANQLDKDLFDRIILINPISVKQMEAVPNQLSKIRQTVLLFPIIGTFIYNLAMNPVHIDLRFRTKYFSKPQLISSKLEDIYYEAAHLGKDNGKYLYASLISNYLNMNMKHTVKHINKPVYIIGARNLKGNINILDTYHKLNTKFNIVQVSNANLYPHMEIPEKIAALIKNVI